MKANELENNVGGAARMAGQVPNSGPLQTLVRRRWQLLGCLLLVSSLAFAATVLRKPSYEATARVQVVQGEPEASGLAPLFGNKSDGFAGQCELLDSRRVLARAIDRLNLAGVPWDHDEEGLRQLRGHMDVRPMAKSRMIDIIGSGPTGIEASAVANHLMAAFIETSADMRAVNHRRMVESLQNQVRIYENEIGAQEDALARFRADNLITGNGAELSVVMGRITTLEGELTRAQMRRLELKAQQEKLSRLMAGDVAYRVNDQAVEGIERDSEVLTCRQKLQQLRQQKLVLAQAYLPGHRKLQSIDGEIAGVSQRLGERVTELVAALTGRTREQYAALAAREQEIEKVLAQQKEISVAMTGRLQEYQKLAHKLELMHSFQGECVKQIRHFSIKEQLDGPPVQVVETASVPTRAAGLSKRKQAGSILVLGLLLSLIFVFAVDRFSLNQEMPAEAAWAGGYVPMPGAWPMYGPWPSGPTATAPSPPVAESVNPGPTVLGQLGRMSLAGHNDAAFTARCQIVQSEASSAQASAFREISAHLLGRFGASRQSLVVTGPTLAGGKTTCACNLALALAQTGRSVCLVEGNPQNPALHRVFGNRNDEGPTLEDALGDPALLEALVQETDVPNLKVAQCWQEMSATTQVEPFAMSQFNQHLLSRCDWVIYDAGCVTNEFTSKLSAVIGKVLLVDAGQDVGLACITTEQVERYGAVVLGCIENVHTDDAWAGSEPGRKRTGV